jgi:small subunit ribosomal protein S13|tara:strand:- start:69967 stop:70461 length:495 start_codon:yes stop_codon:yes gene_type:complete
MRDINYSHNKMQQNKPDLKNEEKIIRIMSKDIGGNMKVYAGLTKIKGISWSFSNAICKILKISKNEKIGDLDKDEIKKISDFIKNPEMPPYIINRRMDFETGENKHLTGSDLELQNEFDVKRLRKIKSYKGYRHAAKLTVRGQRTRGNFRKNRAKGVGIKKKKK